MGTTIQPKTQKSSKVAILVLGMHRSGTSMVAGILDCLGCKGPKTQLEKNDQNPTGYFESTPVVQLNDEILEAAGTRWNDWQSLRDGWIDSPRFNEFRLRAAEILQKEYGAASMIYLKDPRICRLLPLWKAVLEDMGYRVVCIHTHRHPADVTTSLSKRGSISVEPNLSMLSWLRHVLDAETDSRDLPRIFTSYSSLLSDGQCLVEQAQEILGFTWPISTRTAEERVAQLIDQRLDHYGSNIDSFLQDLRNPRLFRETLQILENWSQAGENSDDRAKLEKIRHDFDLSAPLLYNPIYALQAATSDIKSLAPHKATAEARQIVIEELTTKFADAEEQRDQLSSQQEQLRAELEKANVQEEATAEARQIEIEELAAKLADAEEQRDQLSSQQEQLHAELKKADAQEEATAEARQIEIEELAAKLADAEGHRDQLSSQQEQLRAELDDNRAELEKANVQEEATAAAQQIVIEELTTKLTDAEARYIKTLGEVETWVEKTIARDKKNAKLQQTIDRIRHERAAQQAANQTAQQAANQEALDYLENSYKTSTSWRVTAPIRFIAMRLKGHK